MLNASLSSGRGINTKSGWERNHEQARDSSAQALARGACNALRAFDRRRFNRQFTASRFQSFDHRLNLAAGLSGCVISKPFSQRGGVGNGCSPKAQSNANLSAKAFRSSFSEEQSAIGRLPRSVAPRRRYPETPDRMARVGTDRDRGKTSTMLQTRVGSLGS
jgi:hypothetical protein